jgi:exosortase E/protease (VPEID-CTERM system)
MPGMMDCAGTTLSRSRPLLAVVLLVSELLLLSLLVDARTLATDGFVSALLAESGRVVRWVVVSAGVLAVGMGRDIGRRVAPLAAMVSWPALFTILGIHLLAYLVLAVVTYSLFGVNQVIPDHLGLMWLLLVALVFISWCFVVADHKGWHRFLATEWPLLLLALGSGFAIYLLSDASARYWLTMSDFTLQMTAIVLTVVYDVIILDIAHNIIGARDFWVTVDQACSGIEGMVVSLSITAMYLFLSRDFLKFPRALLLLPLACVLSAVFNVIRIALLVVIGAEWFPEIAVKGFHSVAGWVGTVLVALLIVFVFSTWRWVRRDDAGLAGVMNHLDDHALVQAILLPFIVLLVTALGVRIFTDGFNTLYPVVVTATSISVLVMWRRLALKRPDQWMIATAAGAFVAGSWVLMNPGELQSHQSDIVHLTGMPAWQAAGWAMFRLLGFLVMTPIVEELVFRGYLLSRLSGQAIRLDRKPPLGLWALVVSSLLFGFLHEAWLAGVLAGVTFGWLRFRTERIANCILAHGVANGLLVVLSALLYTNAL